MAANPMQERFSRIYATDEWGNGSGEGSLPIHTRGYAGFLQAFIRRRDIGSVLDAGCGDWQFSRHIDWGNRRYLGVDVVESVIEANRARYGSENVCFQVYDGDFTSLPEAELLIVKDVLQHLSHETIEGFLAVLPRFRYALITNCINPAGPTENRDIPDGGFRYLDLTLPPFNLEAEEVYRFSNHRPWFRRLWEKPRWTKKVLLYQAPRAHS